MKKSSLPFYDEEKIGSMIGQGFDHTVFEYDSDRVIKFSRLFFLIGRDAYLKAQKDIELCEKYFGSHFLPTTIVRSRKNNHIAYLQQKIAGRSIHRSDLKLPDIKDQFCTIVRGHEALVRDHGAGLDLIGLEGFVKGTISNIFISDDKLWIIDGTIWEADGILGPIMSAIRLVGDLRQEELLNEYSRV